MPTPERLAEQFEEHRPHVRAVAYRMLGSVSEAEDAVQEAWIRLSRTDVSGVDNLRGWLTTVVARVCLDMLRARASRREDPLDVHVPDPIIRAIGGAADEGPEADSMLAESRAYFRELLEKNLDAGYLVKSDFAMLNEKRAHGLAVDLFSSKRLGELKSHGKIMLIDDEKVVVGSLALAALSLDFRREVAIVVEEPSAVAEAAELFRGLTAAAADARAAAAAMGEIASC